MLNLKKLPTSLNIETALHNSHLHSTLQSAPSDPLSSPNTWVPCWVDRNLLAVLQSDLIIREIML